MEGRLDDGTIAEIDGMCRRIYDSMPQPDPRVKLAACFGLMAQTAGLDKVETTRAIVEYASAVHGYYAQILIHRRDGQIESYTGQDFEYDIRHGSPYYTTD